MQVFLFCYNAWPSVGTLAAVLLFLLNICFVSAQGLFSGLVSNLFHNNIQFSSPEECARQCQDGEPAKYCYYRFTLEYYTAFGRACDLCQVPTNSSGITQLCECVIGDGFEKTIFSLNRQIPGPSIQVCLGDKIIVDVTNEAEGLEASIHWHGIFQKGSQYYDGVPYITQCPILSADTFRYQFRVNNPGTHFYHSHISVHMVDGQYGSLIVRSPPSKEPHYNEYDKDLPEHVMVLSDWFHELSLERFPGRYRGKRKDLGQAPQNILINGRGQWKDPNTGQFNNVSVATFWIQQGKRYRFRIINSFSTVCLCEVLLERHYMDLIATDGESVETTRLNGVTMATGERVDVIITANQQPRYYWIHVRGLGECEEKGVYQVAQLNYEGASPSSLSPKPGYFVGNLQYLFNPPNSTNCNNNLCVDQLNKIYLPNEPQVPLNTPANTTLVLAFDFFDYTEGNNDRLLFSQKANNVFPLFFVANDRTHLVSIINNITNKNPPGPPISQDVPYSYMCSSNNIPTTCTGAPCACTHVINLTLGAVVDIIIYDKKALIDLNHPFHLHGYSFCVQESAQFVNPQNPDNISTDDVERVRRTYQRRLQNNFFKYCSPKDTVIVPNSGYVILRFKADNPGWWFFHCHFSWHTASGMNVVLHVGTSADLPSVPDDFPTCNNWTPNIY